MGGEAWEERKGVIKGRFEARDGNTGGSGVVYRFFVMINEYYIQFVDPAVSHLDSAS